MFPPAEVRRILRRAAELDEAAGAPADQGRGHTLEEIERIAGDAGISAASLERAIGGDAGPERPLALPWSFSGAPGRISVERTVHGSVTAANHAKVAKALRKVIGELGNAQSVGDSLSWSASIPGGRSVYAVIEPEDDGRVTIRIDENLRGLRGGVMGGVLGGVGGGGMSIVAPLIAMLSRPLTPIGILAWMLSVYFLARTIYRSRFRARAAELEKLVGEVATLVESTGPRVAEESAQARRVSAPRDEAAAEDDRADEAASHAQSRRAGR